MMFGGRRQSVLWVSWFGALLLAGAGMLAIRARLEKAHVALIFLLVVLGGSAAGGRVLGLALAFGAFLAFNYFFLPPYLTFAIADPLDWLVLATFLITSIVAAQLLYRATRTAEAATARAAEVDRLATLGAETLNLARPEDALRAILDVIRTTLGVVSCDILVRGTGDGFVSVAHTPSESIDGNGDVDAPTRNATDGQRDDRPVVGWPDTTDTRSSEGLVGWIFAYGRGAVELADGAVRIVEDPALETARPDRSDEVRVLWIRLAVRNETVGVLRVRSVRGLTFTLDQARFLNALAYYAALGVERRRLVVEAERAEAERRVEALRSALLTAVSHDLRTPLTTIKAIAHEIGDGGARDRARVIEDEADRLNALVGDLLDLSRIQSGAIGPSAEVNTADDLIGAALQRADAVLSGRSVEVDLAADRLLTGRFDLTNALRALVNLLENAAKYSPAGSPITIRARQDGDRLRISVLDCGPGVPPGERERIFEPFYRPAGSAPDVRGTGLGLSIARGLALSQGGSVEFEPRDAGGSVFTLLLPSTEGEPPVEADAVVSKPGLPDEK
jgi:two-component system sensor histidine kinase KdpD